jgi:hypothetical protein
MKIKLPARVWRDEHDNALGILDADGQALSFHDVVMALNQALRPEEGWREVEGYEGILKHCGARDAVKLEMDRGAFSGIFCYRDGKFYAYRLPPLLPQNGEGQPK